MPSSTISKQWQRSFFHSERCIDGSLPLQCTLTIRKRHCRQFGAILPRRRSLFHRGTLHRAVGNPTPSIRPLDFRKTPPSMIRSNPSSTSLLFHWYASSPFVRRRTVSFSVRGRSSRQSIFPSLMPLSFFTFFSFSLRIHRNPCSTVLLRPGTFRFHRWSSDRFPFSIYGISFDAISPFSFFLPFSGTNSKQSFPRTTIPFHLVRCVAIVSTVPFSVRGRSFEALGIPTVDASLTFHFHSFVCRFVFGNSSSCPLKQSQRRGCRRS